MQIFFIFFKNYSKLIANDFNFDNTKLIMLRFITIKIKTGLNHNIRFSIVYCLDTDDFTFTINAANFHSVCAVCVCVWCVRGCVCG